MKQKLMLIMITICMMLTITQQLASATQWQLQLIDDIGNVGRYLDIAIDSQGNGHISYYDSTNGDLKYAANVSGSWVTQTVDSNGDVGIDTSIAIDSLDNVHISYYDSTNGDLKYATNDSGSWVIQTIDSVGFEGWDSSIGIDSQGNVHISYFDNTNDDLKYATNASGAWVNQTIDSNGLVGLETSLGIDSLDNVHISYIAGFPIDDLKYAANASGTWVIQTVEGGNSWYAFGLSTSLTIDSSNNIHISYHEMYSGLKYATNASGLWVTQWMVGTHDHEVWNSSIVTDSSDTVHISYFNSMVYFGGGLRYATNSTGIWQAEIAANIPDEDVGRYSSIGIDSNDQVHIGYYNASSGELWYASSVNPTLTVSKNGTGTGTITGNRINCGTDCTSSYPESTSVVLTAIPEIGSVFTGWSGACTGIGTCKITMTGAQNVTAQFTAASDLYLVSYVEISKSFNRRTNKWTITCKLNIHNDGKVSAANVKARWTQDSIPANVVVLDDYVSWHNRIDPAETQLSYNTFRYSYIGAAPDLYQITWNIEFTDNLGKRHILRQIGQ